MKGPIAPPRPQQVMLETQSPEETSSKRNTPAATSTRTMRPKINDPWSDTGNNSPREGRNTHTLLPPPPPPVFSDSTTRALMDRSPSGIDNKSRTSSLGSKGSNHSSPKIPPNSPGRRHRFQETAIPLGKKQGSVGMMSMPSSSGAAAPPPINGGIQRKVRDPAEQEQALFEQRLCEDAYGVAVRKINQYGKANLRYVKCLHVDELNDNSSKRSLSSRSSNISKQQSRRKVNLMHDFRKDALADKTRYALVWGKKKDVQITLDKFTSVRIGKATERAKKNPSPASRILSLIANDLKHPALDIEAPTRLDRDKFARAFARFLDIPLVDGEDNNSVQSAEITPTTIMSTPLPSAASVPGDFASPILGKPPSPKNLPKENNNTPSTANESSKEKKDTGFWQGAVLAANAAADVSNLPSAPQGPEGFNLQAVVEMPPGKDLTNDNDGKDNDGLSAVSSLTGHGYDQELVEELHNALNELRAELDESRAEAARAVKVAEQAIQSAEKNSSQEWQNTVTHKAAEAAALAQKRSAEAMAKQRVAEERLDGEKRTASFWRKQAEVAEEEAGLLQTRAAAAEVRRSGVEEQLESERRIAQAQMESMKARIAELEAKQFDSLNAALQKNSELEAELQVTKQDLESTREEVENKGRKKTMIPRLKKADKPLESTTVSPTAEEGVEKANGPGTFVPIDQLLKLKAESTLVKQQYENLKRSTAAELSALPEMSKQWTDHLTGTLEATTSEIRHLRERLATESTSRRKLLNEVQDLRGIVRVYCRPRPAKDQSVFETPSQETLVVRRDKFGKSKKGQPMSFEFDRIFDPSLPQQDVFGEIQEVCLGVLDGFNITVLAFGQSGCGKTRTLLGEVGESDGSIAIADQGMHLQAMKQLFEIASHRAERYKDTFSLSIVEVSNDRLSDLLSGTTAGDTKGQVILADSSSSRKKREKQSDDDASSGKTSKLEIRSDLHGDTVVHGALTVEVESFEEVSRVWAESIAKRRKQLEEQDIDVESHESSSHVIASLKVTSANIATGHGVIGKLQFVDMAASKISNEGNGGDKSPSSSGEWKFTNRSLETFTDVVTARAQFARSVPYRNSTLTHLLRDSLEGDTKVIFLACVSSDASDLQETIPTLRLASRLRQVTIGKATKHVLTAP